MISRRELGRLALGALPVAAPAGAEASKIDSTIHGVRIGASGYSFQALSLDDSIQAMRQIGLGVTEVWFRHIEPKRGTLSREQLRAWRLSVSLDDFHTIRNRYADAGIDIVAFTYDMKDDFTDAELDRVFQMTRALGVNRIATSTTLTVAARLVPLMEKHKVEVAFHGHTSAHDPNEFANPASFVKALRMSSWSRINLDIGQFVAAGFDPVPFIQQYHQKIPVLHVRDGKPGEGTKLVWGTGITPIRDVLQLLKRERYPIVADIEYDYGGASDPIREISNCLTFCRAALE